MRAALRMQSTLARFVDEVGADPPIQMRIGINTGEVLVGTLAGSDYTAMGDVVNTAARLQSLAPTGGVLIGSATAALCSSTVRREPFADTRIRGREQPEQSWLVTGVGGGEPARPLRRALRRPPPRARPARRRRAARARRSQRHHLHRR